MSKGLKIVLPSAVSDPEGKLRKLEHYYGIEFVRGASNGGGANGYYRLIGDDSLRAEMRFHNQMKIANVKDGAIQYIYNQLNWNLQADGNAAAVDGADGSDVMQVHTKTVYAIIGGTNDTYERFIVSDAPFTYDGDKAIEFDPWGESPDYTTYDNTNKARSIRGGSAVGTTGIGSITYVSGDEFHYGTANLFPRTNQSCYEFHTAARSKNENTAGNVPYTIVNNQDIELAFAFLAIEARTKILTNVFGHGLSSNVGPSAATWAAGKVSGFKVYEEGQEESAVYYPFSQTVYLNGTSAINMWQLVNNYNPLTEMFEAQMSISADNTRLMPITDADGNVLDTNAMTGIWTKSTVFTANISLGAAGTPKTYTIESHFAVPVWRGRTRMQGNLTQWYGGYEGVLTYDGTNNIYDIYRCPNPTVLSTQQLDSVPTGETFAFESAYDKIGTFTWAGGATGRYVKTMLTSSGITTAIGNFSDYQPAPGEAAVGRDNYEAAYVYLANSTDSTVRLRRGALFGGNALYSFSVVHALVRFAYLSNAPSFRQMTFGSAFRCSLP